MEGGEETDDFTSETLSTYFLVLSGHLLTRHQVTLKYTENLNTLEHVNNAKHVTNTTQEYNKEITP